MLSPALADRRRLAQASDLAGLVLLPHPAWPQWLHGVDGASGQQFRYSTIEYPNHELNADAAVAGEGVALLPRSLFESMLEERRLSAPFDRVLADDWHFALLRDGETRREPMAFVDWLSAEVELDRGTRFS